MEPICTRSTSSLLGDAVQTLIDHLRPTAIENPLVQDALDEATTAVALLAFCEETHLHLNLPQRPASAPGLNPASRARCDSALLDPAKSSMG